MTKSDAKKAEMQKWYKERQAEAEQKWREATENERVELAVMWLPRRCKDIDLTKIDLPALARLICAYPKAARGMDVTRFSDEDLSDVLTVLPKWMSKVDPNRRARLNWGIVLRACPSLAKYCDFGWLKVVDWELLLEKRKEFAKQFDPKVFTEADDWCYLLLHCPCLTRFCPFQMFNRKDRIKIASVSLTFAKKIALESLTTKEWCLLMRGRYQDESSTQRWIAKELKRLAGQIKK